MTRFNKTAIFATVVSVVAAGSASAAVDVTAIQTEILADVSTVAAYATVVLAAVLGPSIGIKLIKKFTNKAS